MSDIAWCPPNVNCPCYTHLTTVVKRLQTDNERMRAALKEMLNLPYGSEGYYRVIARGVLDGQPAQQKEET